MSMESCRTSGGGIGGGGGGGGSSESKLDEASIVRFMIGAFCGDGCGGRGA